MAALRYLWRKRPPLTLRRRQQEALLGEVFYRMISSLFAIGSVVGPSDEHVPVLRILELFG